MIVTGKDGSSLRAFHDAMDLCTTVQKGNKR